MAYELRIGRRVEGRFETSGEAAARAREMIRQNADIGVEIIDVATGRPYAPAAAAEDREALARKVGF